MASGFNLNSSIATQTMGEAPKDKFVGLFANFLETGGALTKIMMVHLELGGILHCMVHYHMVYCGIPYFNIPYCSMHTILKAQGSYSQTLAILRVIGPQMSLRYPWVLHTIDYHSHRFGRFLL